MLKVLAWSGSGDGGFAVCSRDLCAVRETREQGREGRRPAPGLAGFFLFVLGIGSPEVSQAGLKSAPWTDHGLRLATIFLLLPSAPELQAYVTIPSLWGL